MRHGSQVIVFLVVLCLVFGLAGSVVGQQITKVYVPYEKLRGILEGEPEGVFLPYEGIYRVRR